MAETLPYVGAVIRYGYLWRDEARAGREEPRKLRPCVILSVARQPDGTEVSVAPITHTRPEEAYAIALSGPTRRRLGLDVREPSWVNAREINVFRWRGVDVADARAGQDHFGPIPRPVRDAVAAAFLQGATAGTAGVTRRTE